MKRILSIIFIGMILVFSANQLKAAEDVNSPSAGEFLKVGAAGGQFLKIGVGPRASAMGGAYGAVANDLTSIFWNPAGLADIEGVGAYFGYTSWFLGFSHNFAAACLPLGEDFTAAVHFTNFTSDEIPITTMSTPRGDGTYYTVGDVAFGLSFSGYLTEQFSFGITGKYVSNGFASMNADGIAFDIGTMYETGIQGIKLGFSIHNLSTKLQYQGQDLRSTKKLWTAMDASPRDVEYLSSDYNLPLIFRAGVASDIIKNDDHNLIGAVDFITYSDVPEQFSLGAEYTWKDLVSLRGGYILGSDSFGLSGGAGLKYIGGGFKGMIDYSITPVEYLGWVNRFSVSLNID